MPGKSILFSATTIGTPAARAWLMASSVCGMTPSSAATTSTAISVTFAPRARISVNASCPGVSTNASLRPSLLDLVGADVLRNAAAFAAGHVDADDLIQQRRFAVVDVPQKRDDRRTRLQFGRIVGLGVGNGLEAVFDGLRLLDFNVTPNSAASSSISSSFSPVAILGMVDGSKAQQLS